MSTPREDLAGFPPAVAEALRGAIERGRTGGASGAPPLAVFDWDNTCIYNDVGDATFDRMLEEGDVRLLGAELEALLPEEVAGRPRRAPIVAALDGARAGSASARRELRTELLALYEDLGPARGAAERYRWVAAMLAGRTEAELEALAEATIQRGLAETLRSERVETADGKIAVTVARGLRVLRPMAALVRSLLDAGWDVRAVSASAEPLVRRFAARIGLGPERVIGVRLAHDTATGRLLPQVLEPFPYDEGKVAAIERFAGRAPDLVAGDSPGDLPMLRASKGLRLVVERDAGSEAARVARREGWLVARAEDLLGNEAAAPVVS